MVMKCSVVQVVLRWTDKTRSVSIISFLLYTLELTERELFQRKL